MSVNHIVTNSNLAPNTPTASFLNSVEHQVTSLLGVPFRIFEWDGTEKPEYRTWKYQLFKYTILGVGIGGFFYVGTKQIDGKEFLKILGSVAAFDWVAEAIIWRLYLMFFSKETSVLDHQTNIF